MLSLPFPSTDRLKLADWLEIHALLTDDRHASLGDLERALHREVEEARGRDHVERLCEDVFGELAQRAVSAGPGYPFTLDTASVRARGELDTFVTYNFCLCLSFFGWEQKKGSKWAPRRLFEDLSGVAAANFLAGSSTRFSTPRIDLPSSFKKAIQGLCDRLGEGGGWKEQALLTPQDDAVDIIAWRQFPDQLAGQLLLFGQCASGHNWETKVNDLQPEAFCQQWMIAPPPSKALRAMFIPHRVERADWDRFTRRAGILFDRCRISYYIDPGVSFARRENLAAWTQMMLDCAV